MKFKIFGTTIRIDESQIDTETPIKVQLEEYANGERKEFEAEVEYPDGFLGKVRRKMSEIPYGETRTYGDIAEDLGTSARAVGQACGRNPTPIIVPCHRVVAADGIGGYQYGELKEKLLELESCS